MRRKKSCEERTHAMCASVETLRLEELCDDRIARCEQEVARRSDVEGDLVARRAASHQ